MTVCLLRSKHVEQGSPFCATQDTSRSLVTEQDGTQDFSSICLILRFAQSEMLDLAGYAPSELLCTPYMENGFMPAYI